MWLYVHRTLVTFRSISFLIEEKEAKDGESRFFDGSMELRELSDVYQKPEFAIVTPYPGEIPTRLIYTYYSYLFPGFVGFFFYDSNQETCFG